MADDKKQENKQDNKQNNRSESKQDKKDLGLTVKKADDFSEWYNQLLIKAELIEFSSVSGCYILRPRIYSIWEKIQSYFDNLIKKDGVKNAYFPLLIPESLLTKEAKHIAGFAPEVAWVTQGGSSPLPERLAIRPTSETIMYDTYSKWIRSYRDLPLRLNQWANVVRWEFKHPVALIRFREFLWQEGHTVFATKREAVKEAKHILKLYKKTFEELCAIPVIIGRKSEQEKFAGADTTFSVEALMPSGKIVQGGTSHNLGQNFAKSFGIKFVDEKGEEKFAWQNSWGISTRMLGIVAMLHSDDKGFVVPPRLAENKVVVIPIFREDSKEKVLAKAQDVMKTLKKHNPILDDRTDVTPGFKYNDWELKGIPLRIEIGPRDIEKDQVVIARRDNGSKEFVPFKDVAAKVKELLRQMQHDMFVKAKHFLESSIILPKTFDELKAAVENGKIAFAPWCCENECEDWIKDKTGGAKTLNIPFKQPKEKGICVHCGKPGKVWMYFGKSY